ncbi:ATP-dependent sacrificial sulfur transferase LarE [Candidatus Omnitrophota bacterium]
MAKLKKLEGILKGMSSVLLAYSGGVDSTFLLATAHRALGKKVLAVTAVSATYPQEELDSAKRMAKKLGARHKVIKTNEFADLNFRSNPRNRCYYCKRELFSKLKRIAVRERLNFVADASNISDKKDFRPGRIAKKELAVRSPLQEAGLAKDDIRRLSKKMGLVTWNKPALACLASRVPYGTQISRDILSRVDLGERVLRGMGFKVVRLRHYNGLCRIEVGKDEIPRLIKKHNQVARQLKRLGYDFITLDLQGYRTGSMNEVIPRNYAGKNY